MNLTEKVCDKIHGLPPDKVAEVLDFVEFLQARAGRREDSAWNALSVRNAMKGMENEETVYTEADMIENYKQ